MRLSTAVQSDDFVKETAGRLAGLEVESLPVRTIIKS